MAQQTVHLFVFDTLADWEASYAIAGINSPSISAADGRYRVQTVGITGEPVTTAGGVRIQPDIALEELDAAGSALLIVPGSDRWAAGELSEVMLFVARFLEAGVPVAAICGATVGRAWAGFLDTVQHTSNAAEYLQATGYAGAAHYQEAATVEDGASSRRARRGHWSSPRRFSAASSSTRMRSPTCGISCSRLLTRSTLPSSSS